MNENLNMTNETQGSAAGGRRANPSDYLDRKSSTILMVIKLAEGLSKLCLVILAAFVLQTLVSALNRIFQQGSTVADGKAMVAQFLKTLRFPAETIKQIVDAFPSNITFSSGPVIYVFMISLPFVLIAVLEAIAAIRLRLGKGGTRTIGILQRIYFALDAIRLLVYALMALILSIFTIIRLGGTAGILVSTVYVSLAVFFILIGIPGLLYHRNMAGIMDDVRYEMETGRRSLRKQPGFKQILTILIVLEVIGAVVMFAATWRPGQGGIAVALLIGAMIGPAARLLKYICVKCCYRNFIEEDGSKEPGVVSHIPQIILIVLVILFFAVPDVFLCMKSSDFSTAIAEKVEEFFSNARQTVDELSTVAESQIAAVESAIAAGTESFAAAEALLDGTQEETAAVAEAPQEETAAVTEAPQEATAAVTEAPQAEAKAETAPAA